MNAGTQVLLLSSITLPGYKQRAALEIKEAGHESTPVWEAFTTGWRINLYHHHTRLRRVLLQGKL